MDFGLNLEMREQNGLVYECKTYLSLFSLGGKVNNRGVHHFYKVLQYWHIYFMFGTL